MPTLLIDMPSGVAGDMLLAALLACGGDRAALERDLLALGCGPIRVRATPVAVGALAAVQVDIDAEQEPRWIQAPAGFASGHGGGGHGHRPYAAIRDLLGRAALPERVKARAQRCFRLLAEAEGAVHGVPPETVEFHEVGSLDAIADVVGCCLLLEQLGVERVLAGPIAPGSGTVRCAHGLMPVPVPAVAEMLRATGAPVRLPGRETGELTTPTGCALVCGLADAFIGAGEGCAGRITATGYGAGHRQIPGLVNAVRCLLLAPAAAAAAGDGPVALLEANLDDMTGEDLALAAAELLRQGALDAWTVPALMKKGRPAHVLAVLARPEDRQRLGEAMLRLTTTIGLRWSLCERMVLPRTTAEVLVQGQRVRLKTVTLPDGTTRSKPEADDVAAAALALGISPAAVRAACLPPG